MATDTWGKTTPEIQKNWMNIYHKAGIKVLVSAFGATDFPTTDGRNAIDVANSLAAFVKANNLDGVDLDYEDNGAMNQGKGEKWICDCTQRLRQLLPAPYIITHAPQGPYFMGPPSYPSGGYTAVEKTCGSGIDWYNIQFYNQDTTKYDTFTSIFMSSDGWASGTSVSEIGCVLCIMVSVLMLF
uniref:GH18 domain-containing protein n=1 Tax=Arcella intermedia TaxID=1963864 RepID=A0A6B2LFD3_9EUKA